MKYRKTGGLSEELIPEQRTKARVRMLKRTVPSREERAVQRPWASL